MFFIVFLLVLIIYAIINLLISKKIYSIFKIKIKKPIFTAITVLVLNSYLFFMLLSKYIPSSITTILAYITSYLFSTLIYIAILFFISFILTKIFKPKKHNYYIISLILIPVILIIGTFLSHSSYIKEYDIKVNKDLNQNYKIALVSDIHLGDIVGKNRLDHMIEEINSLNVDIVLIAGDIVDSNLDTVINKDLFSSFKNLKSTYGTFATLGNHDGYTKQSNKLVSLLTKNNVTVLRNKYTLIDDSLYILGRDDTSINDDNLNLIMKDLNTSKNIIVIDHTPNRIDESIDNNIDLQVSGHTHNGQIFPGNLFTSLLFKTSNGYDKYNDTNVIVSSGYGTWGPPIRTTSRSEIVLINLHN